MAFTGPMRRILLFLALSAVGCEPSAPDSAGWQAVDREVRARYPDVRGLSTEAFAAWLGDASRPPPLLLDARTPAEVAVSHLAGARHVDPDASADALGAALADVDRQRPVVVYCSVGWRSAAVAERLQAAGFRDVQNLEGSIFRWANEGRPVIREGRPVREVHPYDAVWGRLLKPELRASPPGA